MRPVMLALAGDSAAGKTTFSQGIVRLLGEERVAVVGTDDYHRYDRAQRKELNITPLNPDCNYMDIMAQQLGLLAAGEPILKPVYEHSTGSFGSPEYVEPRQFTIAEGLLPLYTKQLRDCFAVKVYLDPPEELRRQWKIERDCTKRGYTRDQVLEALDIREPDSAAFIRPQRQWAAHVVRFEPPNGETDSAHLSMRMVLRPTLPHRDLIDAAEKAAADGCPSVRLELARDEGGPFDHLHVDGGITPEETDYVESLLWERMNFNHHLQREDLGQFLEGNHVRHSDSLAIAQLFIAYHLLSGAADHATGHHA